MIWYVLCNVAAILVMVAAGVLHRYRYSLFMHWPDHQIYIGDHTRNLREAMRIARRARPNSKPLSESNRVNIILPAGGYKHGVFQFKAEALDTGQSEVDIKDAPWE